MDPIAFISALLTPKLIELASQKLAEAIVEKVVNLDTEKPRNQPSCYDAAPLSRWSFVLPEAYRADLVDLRLEWQDQPITWYSQLRINLLTLKFIWDAMVWANLNYWWQNRFYPRRRPRL